MDAEKLKVIAEGMGYEYQACLSREEGRLCVSKKLSIVVFDPLTNNDQMVEIMEKLEICLARLMKPDAWQAIINDLETREEIFAEGKTINEAVCNAAYEYFNNT